VLIIGDLQRAEFASVLESVDKSLAESFERHRAADIEAAVRLIEAGVFPDLVLVLQSWSNEYSADEVNCLLTLIPLARLVVCYGPWCESDGRNFSVWPHPVRVPFWAAQRRVQREWQSILEPYNGPLIPWSASRDELFAADHPAIQISAKPQLFFVD